MAYFSATNAHRRTMSTTTSPVHVLTKGHRRTFSNNAADLQKILKKNTANLSVAQEESGKNSVKGGFVGVLDAAIVYFKQERRQNYEEKNTLLPDLSSKMQSLESENEELRQEIKRLTSQREQYVSHIGDLNTKILDLELALQEALRKRSEGELGGRKGSPRDSLRKGKHPTPGKAFKPA